jgi:lipopolysaccharide export system protein LptA
MTILPLRHVSRLALAAFFALFCAASAFPQSAAISLGVENHDNSAPVEITSENLELDQEAGTASFTGDVIVRQGEMTLSCTRMVVEYGTGTDGSTEIETIRMFGGVTFASPSEAAEAETAVYSLANDTLIMSGRVLVTQGGTALSSDKLSYNLASGAGELEGNVKTVLNRAAN